jgi:hypothetical protein
MRMIRMRIFRVYMVVAMGMSMRMTVTVIMAVVMVMAVVMMIVPFGLFFQSAQPGAKAVTEGAILNIRARR